ncbi:ATP-binding protein [Roseateles asaccharophilus]|uniref:histidine kinase n=1 Tax=Roseateles asaccharophilus TaxID=582607 RepID=A0ABU2ABI8_9BURK|nr:ATP-binding protein [Roseateles asaccharophilus]MDR7334370.1 PAS domain S-box-containing protein [Roseateles asaccharophilus]
MTNHRAPSRTAGQALLAQGFAALLALAVVLVLAAFVTYERREVLKNAQERAELIARTLEDHVTRTVDSASLILQTLAEAVSRERNIENFQPLLDQPLLTGLPFLRGAAILDDSGSVLASSITADRGGRVDLRKLGTLPGDGRDALLPLVRGRSLADLAPDAPRPRATGVVMQPLLRALRGPDGRQLLLVALINPGALANFQQAALAEPGGVAMLSSLGGQLIAVNDRLQLEPGALITSHPVFQSWLPDREHGEYLGTGTQAGPQVVAFRASRKRPLAVIIELDEAAVLTSWRERLRWLGLLALLTLVAIGSGLVVVLRQIRAQDRARLALDLAHEQVALREREMSVLLKSVQELIFRTDVDGVITFVNARWAAVSNGDMSSAHGLRLTDLVVCGDKQRTAELFRPDDRAGVRQAQVCVPQANGQRRHFLVAVVPLQGGDGRLVGFAGSAVDVSEQVAAERQVSRQLAFTGLLQEISPLPVSMFDTAGRYVMVNQAWEDFVGRSRDQVVGAEVGHFLPAEAAALHAGLDAQLMARGGRIRYEARVQHQDGSLRDMVVTKVVVPGEHGQPAGILCTLMDVSEFRDAERATREARDVAERASRAKSEFVANISHELRTPLQAILGFSELGMTRGGSKEMLAGMFTDIHLSGRRMLALVNDLLDVSKLESTVGGFEMERCDLRTLLQAALRELDPLLNQRRLQLNLSLPSSELSAEVDPGRIHQAVRNVVANAIKFSPEGAEVHIEARRTADDRCEVSVADRGPGIPAAELESVFEAFVQSSRTKDGSGGTGLGLAICRKILGVHGGQITAENRTGGGALFRLQLPLAMAN